MVAKATTKFIDFSNQALEREFPVAVQYSLRHAKVEKIIKKQIHENILLDKTTCDAVGKIFHEISIQEIGHAAYINEEFDCEMKE